VLVLVDQAHQAEIHVSARNKLGGPSGGEMYQYDLNCSKTLLTYTILAGFSQKAFFL